METWCQIAVSPWNVESWSTQIVRERCSWISSKPKLGKSFLLGDGWVLLELKRPLFLLASVGVTLDAEKRKGRQSPVASKTYSSTLFFMDFIFFFVLSPFETCSKQIIPSTCMGSCCLESLSCCHISSVHPGDWNGVIGAVSSSPPLHVGMLLHLNF